MRNLGLVLIIVGVLALLFGLFACFVTLKSDYASSSCERAAADKAVFDKAKTTCGSVTSDCYKQMTVGLTAESECDARKSFMRNQLLMSVAPVAVGLLLAAIGFFLSRRKTAAA